MKKSLGLSCIVNGVYVSPNILYPKVCWVIKGNRGGYFETRGGGGHLKLTSDYRGGGYVQWGGGNLKVLHRANAIGNVGERKFICTLLNDIERI